MRTHAWRNEIRIYRFANSGNHLHILMLSGSRQKYLRFIRTITGLIARATLEALGFIPRSRGTGPPGFRTA